MDDQAGKTRLSYADAGVDIEAGDQAVDRIRSLAKATFNESVLTEIGSFGGLFQPSFDGYSKPVLISSADGVGTKLKLAFMTNRHDTVGEDLVNHCVNDILVHGARPLFFLDYIATGKLNPQVVEQLVVGLSRGCKNTGMALIGGETAEMPDFYSPGEYDLAGFIVGMVDRERIINGSAIKSGDVCLGLASTGLHTNGYTLARKIVFEAAGLEPDSKIPELGQTAADALLTVHRCYLNSIQDVLAKHEVNGMAHVTGGGIEGNLSRIIPDGLSAVIDRSTWEVPGIFRFLQKGGNVEEHEMYRAFNMGVGYILVVTESESGAIAEALRSEGETVFAIGKVQEGEPKVRLV